MNVLTLNAPAPPVRSAQPARIRLALLRDYAEEYWPSMDLCAEMLHQHLCGDHAEPLAVADSCPPFRRRLQRLPGLKGRRAAFNGDRLLNRLWDYPRHVRRLHNSAELFHVVDHSYAQLLHVLPAGQVGVYCHDVDTFRCLFDPPADPRPRWFRTMARHILGGLQKAAVVFHSTNFVRAEIERFGLVESTRLVHAPLGCAPEFRSDPEPDLRADAIFRQAGNSPYLLHVGSCIPRKRIDVLLEVFARLRLQFRSLRLVKVGGEWTTEHRKLLNGHRLSDAIVHVNGLPRSTLARLYGGASLVLMPSDAEGFGLPVLEALACGAPVLCSDLPVFHEVGGNAVRYASAGDADEWTQIALEMLRDPERTSRPAVRIERAAHFSWRRHAHIIADAYLRIAR
jgi:glycosyltransferase involved in cell wall biosynthesis